MLVPTLMAWRRLIARSVRQRRGGRMSGFEFVLVLYAIIVGLGISSILADWGEQIRARHQRAHYPLQIALSVVVLLFGMYEYEHAFVRAAQLPPLS